MFDRTHLSQLADLYEPANEEAIREAERSLQLAIPEEYGELLKCTNGLDVTVNGDRYAISLFRADELAERRQTYSVDEWLPGYLFIGFDGGGRGLFLRSETKQSPVYLCHVGILDESELREVASNLAAWIEDEFDLGDPPDEDHPDTVDFYLLREPKDGVRGLMKICKRLQLSIAVSEFRGILANLPYRLCRDVSYLRYSTHSRKINETDPCTGIFEVDRPDRPVA